MKISHLTMLSLSLLIAQHSVGESFTWSGTNDDKWDLVTQCWTDSQSQSAIWANTGSDEARFNSGASIAVDGTIDLGSLVFTGGSSTIREGTLNFGDNQGSIDSRVKAQTNINSNLTGTGGLTIAAYGDMTPGGNGDGNRLNLNGDNRGLSGGITITTGLVQFGSTDAMGTGPITLNGGGIIASKNFTSGNSSQIIIGEGTGTFRAYGGATFRHNGKLTGSGELRITDGGTLHLAGDISGFTGTISQTQSSSTLIMSGGSGKTIQHYHIAAGSGTIKIYSNHTVTLNKVTGGTLNKTDDGSLILAGDNTYGDTNFRANGYYDITLTVGNGGTTGTLGTGYVNIDHVRSTLRFNRSDHYQVDNLIKGNGHVDVMKGSITLTNANEYTGNTTVRSGATLNLANDLALGTNGNLTLQNNALLVIEAGISLEGIANLNADGATIMFEDSTSSLSMTGNLSLDGATLDLTGFGIGSYDLNSYFGITGFDFSNVAIGINSQYNYEWLDNSVISITGAAIPEPSSWTLGLLGAGLLACRRRRSA